MPVIPFTIRKLDSLKPPASGRVDYWDEDLPGFGLRISDRGSRTWLVMYRVKGDGRQRRLKLGTNPPMTLADARDAARDALRAAQKGGDPAAERDTSRSGDSVKALAELYIEKHAKPNKRTWANDERMLKKDIIRAWGTRKARSIRRRDVIELLDAVAKRGPIMANRTYEVTRRMFRFAVERDIVDASPCIGVTKPGTEKSRQRVLTVDETKAVWEAIAKQLPLHAAVFHLRFLTAQRGAEVRSMRWSDIDPSIDKAGTLAWWTIPPEAAKNGKAHRVPLTADAIQVLRDVREIHSNSLWVFPGKEGKSMGDQWWMAERIRIASGVDFNPHDLRRTAASMMTGMGIPRFTVAQILNHTEAGATKIYDRHSYDLEKQRALEAWSYRLMDIVSGKEPVSNVVELDRARA